MKSIELGEILKNIKLEICYHSYKGENIKTLLLTFEQAIILSSNESFKKVKAICNIQAPPVFWGEIHKREFRFQILRDLNLKASNTAVLLTGADIERFGIAMEEFRDLKVCTIATAGMENAMRVGVDRASTFEINGKFEQIGTINIIILTNATLSRSAMVGAIITATEGKVIALQDLNIKSRYSNNLATGTGTDSIIIASGESKIKLRYAGGHTKLGEFIARTASKAVKEAIENEVFN
jgi:adenosylcobinamide amidohydrolase